MSAVPINLVWLTPNLAEVEYIRFLLDGMPILEHSMDTPIFMPKSLYVVGSNQFSPNCFDGRFLKSAEASGNVGLFHLSDEWFRGDYQTYRSFAFVLRTHHAAALVHPGIRIVPLGWPNGGLRAATSRPSLSRRFVWAFAGNRIASRIEMLDAFEDLKPGVAEVYSIASGAERSLSQVDYLQLLSDTQFVPCPMGNVMLESWRLYEALEAGCIPLVERRLTVDYFRDLLGPHPIPTFRSWKAARQFVDLARESPQAVEDLQETLAAWWKETKVRLQIETQDFIAQGLLGTYVSRLRKWRFPSDPLKTAWQYQQLIRHGTLASLTARLRSRF